MNNYNNSMPLVINTQGWVKGTIIVILIDSGMGYDLLKFFLLKASPDTVFHISNDSQAHILQGIFIELKDSNIYNIPSYSDLALKSLHSSDYRNLSLVSYFSQGKVGNSHTWDFTDNSNFRIPYSIPWNDVIVQFFMHHVHPSQSLYALNGSIVALCKDTTKYGRNKDSSLGLLPPDYNNLCDCIGLGLVRSIDATKRVFYISTPLDPSYFDDIQIIVKASGEGGILLPASYSSKDGFDPYLSFGVVQGLASRPLKTRRLIRNERLQ